MERDFKGVWFPRELWLNKDLSMVEKALFVEIQSLDRTDRHCFANNKYFAEFLNCSLSTIKRAIHKLVKLSYISIKKKNDKRTIYTGVGQNDPGVGQNDLGVGQNDPHNNTGINTVNNKDNYRSFKKTTNTSNLLKIKKIKDEAIKVFNFLNMKKIALDKKLSLRTSPFMSTRANLELIEGRLREGYHYTDLTQVVCLKYNEWGSDADMRKYLRPSTLFGRRKFNQYAGEIERFN